MIALTILLIGAPGGRSPTVTVAARVTMVTMATIAVRVAAAAVTMATNAVRVAAAAVATIMMAMVIAPAQPIADRSIPLRILRLAV